MKRQKVERTRAGGLWTEARFWQFIRTALRHASQRWPARIQAKQQCRRSYKGPNKRQKWEYQCRCCKQWVADKHFQMNHLIPCGSVRSFEELAVFAQRLFCEADGFEGLCLSCHKLETNRQRTQPSKRPKPIRIIA